MAWGMQFRMTIKGMWLGSSIYLVLHIHHMHSPGSHIKAHSRLVCHTSDSAKNRTIVRSLCNPGSLQQCASVLSGTHRSSTT